MISFIKQIFSKPKYYLLPVIFFIGIALGWTINQKRNAEILQYAMSIHALRINDSKHSLISPLLIVESTESSYKQDSALNNKINTLIKQKETENQAEKISVYYRNLKTGLWVDINKDETYDPASLLKVPLMVAYLKQAETEPGTLQKTIPFTKEINQSSKIPFEQNTKLSYGSNNTVDQLLFNMITESDNGAMDSLLNTVDPTVLSETYTDLGIKNPDSESGNYEISPKTYSLFFRILYNATYLNADMSQKALQLLSQATFKDGLVNGLPQNLTIAHKFGEHINTDPSGQQQVSLELHDCGIIYQENSPYILCVMTKGANITNLQHSISDISKLVYNQRTRK